MYSKEAVELGADAVMIAPPRLAKPNDDAIYAYYRELGRELNIPIVVQDEPVTYGVHLSPALLARLAEIDRVEYIKLEDPPTTMKMSQMRKLIGERLRVFGGLGGLYAYEELSRGACGIMTGFSYPEVLVKLYQEFVDRNTHSARELFYRALPIIRYEAQPVVGLAIRKEILRRRGAIKYSRMRDPAAKLDPESLKEIDEIIEGTDIAELLTA
jgi:4-hydroxy-tetrahydrodipicolinate synthase